jgi:HAMP domain-containing protein
MAMRGIVPRCGDRALIASSVHSRRTELHSRSAAAQERGLLLGFMERETTGQRARPAAPSLLPSANFFDLLRELRAMAERAGVGQTIVKNGRAGTPRERPVSDWDRLHASSRNEVEHLVEVLKAVKQGNFAARVDCPKDSILARAGELLNDILGMNEHMTSELVRVGKVVGQEGKMHERASVGPAKGAWADGMTSVNQLIADLVAPTNEVARVITAVARGDLTQKMALEIEGRPVRGEFLRIGTTVNSMVDQLNSFAAEVTRVAKEVGNEGKLGGQADVRGVSGTWKDLTDNVNGLAANLTAQVRSIAKVTTAVAQGDLSQKITVDAKGEILELKNTINVMVDQLSSFAAEVTRVAKEVGNEGKLGGQADVKGVSGTWKDLTDNVNGLAANLTAQVRSIAKVTTAVANGDLSQKITVDARGEIFELKNTINTMVDTLRSFAAEVTRVAKEVGTEGKLGGQADVKGVYGTWKDLTDNVNAMASNLTVQCATCRRSRPRSPTAT